MARDPNPRPPPPPTLVPFKINFLSLSPRVIGILIPMLELSQVYKLSKMSRKWQAAVKAAEMVLETLVVDFQSDDYEIEVVNESQKVVIVVPHCEPQQPNEDREIVVENAEDPDFESSRRKQLAIALSRLSKMFAFEKRELLMVTQPDLYETVAWLNSTCDVRFSHLTFGGTEQTISRRQLHLIMTMLFGKELVIENVEKGESVRLPTNFEVIQSIGSNWFTEEMLMNLPGRELHIRQHPNDNPAISIDILSALVKKWYEGGFVKLRYFTCHIFVDYGDAQERVSVMNNILQNILAGIPVTSQVPNDAPDNIRELLPDENRFFIERTNGKRAALFIPSRKNKDLFYFRVWIRNQQNDDEDINEPMFPWALWP